MAEARRRDGASDDWAVRVGDPAANLIRAMHTKKDLMCAYLWLLGCIGFRG